MNHPTTTEVQPIEEVAGDAMGAILQFAMRSAKHHHGERWALAAQNAVEMGSAQLHAALVIGGNSTRITCALVPGDGSPHQMIANIDLVRPATAH
ncbi:MAG: hypothetical protein Q8R33_00370 [Burkholderiales bacterium]|nr:hypothetical protein [Burkholderiales bacterium]